MRVAIMQPYFFPYIGYFQLMYASDRFILMDDVQYIRHGWINRNRILMQDGLQYIILPLVKHAANTLIRNIEIVDAGLYKEKIIRQLDYYRKKAPYFKTVQALLANCLSTGEKNITRMNAHCLKAVCDYTGIHYRVEIASEMNFDYSDVKETADWAICMSKQLSADEYVNAPGGKTLYDQSIFDKNDIQLRFLEPVIREYDQRRNGFQPSLSIIDVMMFNSPAEIKSMLGDYELSDH
jgi:hypothetical protein